MRVRGLDRPFLFGNRYFAWLLPLVVATLMVVGIGVSVAKIAKASEQPNFAVSSLIDQTASNKLAEPASTDVKTAEVAVSNPVQPRQPAASTLPVGCAVAPATNLVAPQSNSTSAATIVIDSPSHYSFNAGNTYTETLARARQCARQQTALGGFDASTSYALNWSYAVVSTGSSTCKLTSVKVSMRIKQTLPSANTSSLSGSELATWQSNLARLVAHENQHTGLDVAAANRLYRQLSELSADCVTIKQQAARLTAAADASLRAENDSLDATSHHGAL